MFKLLYFGVCTGGFCCIYIDKQVIAELILRIVKQSHFGLKIDNIFSSTCDVSVDFREVIINREVHIFSGTQFFFYVFGDIGIFKQ